MTFRDKVLAVCSVCGEEWNVPKNAPVPEPYVCPKCAEYRAWCEEYGRKITKEGKK